MILNEIGKYKNKNGTIIDISFLLFIFANKTTLNYVKTIHILSLLKTKIL